MTTIVTILLLSVAAYGATGLTLQGRIIKPNNTPVESANVQFRIQIRSAGSEDCLLFQETQSKDMRNSNGLFSLTIGEGIRSSAVLDGGYSLDRIFANRGTMDFSATSPAACSIGSSFSPGVADHRKLVYSFNDGNGWELLPSLAINWVPQALESLQVGGYRATQLMRVTDASGNPQSAPNLTPAQALELLNLITGATIQYVKPGSATFTAAPQYAGTVSGANDLTNKAYVDTAVASAVATGLPDVGTPGTYTKVTTDAKGRVTAGATLAEADIPTLSTADKVSGTAINTGTIGGNAAVNTSGNIVTSGTVSSNIVSGNSLRLYDGATNYVSLAAPTLAGIVSFKLPSGDGSAGQVLKTDGSGNLGWVSVTSGTVTSVTSGGAPITVGGTAAAPTISITQSGASSDGYLSSTDWNTFNNKLGTASAFSGDVTGTSSTTSVDKIKGKVVAPVAYSAGQTLRYDGTNWVNTALPFADLASKPTTLAGYGITDASSSTLGSGQIFVGNGSNVATAVTMSGDATLSNAGILTLNTVPTSKGGTGSTSFTANQLVGTNGTGTALTSFSCTTGQILAFGASGVAGCENVNGAGLVTRLDASANLNLTSSVVITGSAAPAVSAAGKGQIYFDSTANKFKISQNGGAYVDLVSGTVTAVSANAPLSVTNGSTTPDLSISQANTTTDGYLSSTDWNTFNNKQTATLNSAQIWVGNGSNAATARTASGDVSLDNAGVFAVNQIKGYPLDFTAAPTSGEVLKYNGTRWVASTDNGITTETDPNVQAWGKAAPNATNFDTTGNVLNLKDTAVTAGSYGGASSVATFTVDAKGRLTAAGSVTVDDTTKLPLGGGTMTGAIAMGGNNITNVGNLELAASKYLGVGQYAADPATGTWGNPEKGRTWFNTTSNELKYWDGAAIRVLGIAGSGITSFNGSTQGTQTLETPGTSGTAPNWSTNAGTGAHTLNIPMASTAAVTAGLISKTKYDEFDAKLGTASTFSGDVTGTSSTISVEKIRGKNISPAAYASGQTLRYNGTQWINAVLDFADLGNKPTTLAGYGITDAASTTLANGKILVGNGSNVATAVTMSGDATLSNAGILTLNTVPTSKGGTGSTSFTANQLVGTNGTGTALTSFSCTTGQILAFGASGVAGCENVNGAGLVTRLDSSANLNLSSSVIITGSAAPAVSAAGKGQIYFDSTANKFKISQNGGAYTDLVSGGTVTTVTANAPLSVTSGSTTPDLSIAQANTTTSGYITSTDWNTFNNKLGTALNSAQIWVGNGSNVATARTASGDVALDNAGVFAVNKIKGYPLDFTAAPTSGEILKYNGTSWAPAADTGGIASLNGSTQTTQTLETPGTSGTAPNWSTNAGTGAHTLNIPMASTAAVTAGLLSKTKYDEFDAKLGTASTFSGDVSGTASTIAVEKIRGKNISPAAYAAGQTLRYNGTQWVNATLDFADLSNKPTTLAGYGITDASSSTLADGKIFVGNGSNVATAVSLSGDATIANTGVLTLNTVPVTKGGTGRTSFGNGRVLTTHSTTGAIQDTTCAQYQVISFDASGNWYCANVNSLSATFFNGGNSFGAAATLGTNDNYALNFETNNTTRMNILANGNVGIGATTPAEALSVSYGANADIAIGSSTNNKVYVGSYGDSGVIALNRRVSDGVFANTGQASANIGLYGASANSYLSFSTANVNNVNPTERMRIDKDGKVGIGTSTPDTKLSVVGGTISGGTYYSTHKNYLDLSSDSGGNAAINFTMDSDNNPVGMGVNKADVLGTGDVFFQPFPRATGYGIFETWGGAGTVVGTGNATPVIFRPNRSEAMRIASGGNVGIGKAAPTAKLHLSGETGQFPVSLKIDPSAHATSRRAAMSLDNWDMGQDADGDGTKNFFLWNTATSQHPFFITAGDLVGIGTKAPTSKLDVNGAVTQRGMAAPAVSPAGQGRIYFDSTANKFKVSQDGGAYVDLVNTSSGGITSFNGSTQGTQTLETPGTSGTAPNWSTNAGTGAHTLNIPMASTASVTAGLISKTKYDEFDAKLGTASTFSGDVSGTASTISVEKIRGKNISPAAYASGQTLRYNGTQWINAVLDFADLGNKPTTLAGYGITDAASTTLANGKILVGNGSNVATAVTMSGDATLSNAGILTLQTVPVSKGGTGLTSFSNGRVLTTNSTTGALQNTTCAQYQVISFDASGNWYCANVNALAGSYIDGGNSFAGNATIGTNDNYKLGFETNGTTRMTIDTNGFVGIGTATPTGPLHVEGSTTNSGNGAPITLIAQASTSNDGGAVLVKGGEGGTGGAVTITGGPGWISGDVWLYGGHATSNNANPGNTQVTAGSGINNNGGTTNISGGQSWNGTGGTLNITSGNSVNGTSGNVYVVPGPYGTTSGNVVLGATSGGTVRGQVGVGLTSPTAKLDVGGQARSVNSSGVAQVNASASVNWNNGNAQSMSVDCATTTFTNMLDGGTYLLAVTETGTSTCVFSHTGLTFLYSPANGARTSGGHTVYTFQRIGTNVYVNWIAGFQ